MYYFIKYEYKGHTYETTCQPGVNPIYRCMSITAGGAKIIDIQEHHA